MITPVERIRIWHCIRTGRRFTCADVANRLDCSLSVVQKYVQSLHIEGILEFLNYDKHGSFIYSVAKDYRRQLRPPLVDFDSTREKLWLTMRLFRSFTVESLQTSVGCSKSSVHKFLRRLAVVGVIRRESPERFDVKNDSDRYSLILDLGALPPVFAVDGLVLDSNTGVFLEAKE